MMQSAVQRHSTSSSTTGFTLIEMMVAASLVVLMMSIFAEVFQIASGSMTLQRALAENDQQVRTFVTVMRSDLQKRTVRTFVPFYPRESHQDQGVPFATREGYFYISANDFARQDDTVLQFTVNSRINIDSNDETPYYGRATLLGPAGSTDYLRKNPNQPESDDGQIQADGAASSSKAQVVYFLRNGNLYRRVVLIREPLSVAASGGSASSSSTINPKDNAGSEFLKPSNNAFSGSYWEAFDFSAWRSPFSGSNANVQFIGVDGTRSDLDNQLATAPSPLGRSRYRFGFDQATGQSREYFGANNELFLGRFSHQETSSASFAFPFGLYNGNSNPFAPSTTLLDANSDGIVDAFIDGDRIGEDLLLTNVHGFDVEVYDDRRMDFASPGYSTGAIGDFHQSRCLNNSYFPPSVSNFTGRCFDTWHPWYSLAGSDANPAAIVDEPPYRPMSFDPADRSAPLPTNAGNSAHWKPNVAYGKGDVVFPPTEDGNYNGILDASEDGSLSPAFGSGGGLIDDLNPGWSPSVRRGVSRYSRTYHYKCVKPADNGYLVDDILSPLGLTADSYGYQPEWGTRPGEIVSNTQPPPSKPFPADFSARTAWWQVVLNVRPVRSIRITVRFLHQSSNKMRQLTLMHSLRDESL